MSQYTFDKDQALALLSDVGAYLKGHFLLTTGRHSNQFFLLARLTEHPALLAPWAEALSERLKGYGALTVIGPAVGGIIPAYAVASFLPNARVLFAEKTDEGQMTFKRGFRIAPGEPLVVVEDAVTTGSSVEKVIQAAARLGGEVRAVGALIDRSQGSLAFQKPLEALLRLGDIPHWDPQECPLCREGIALTRPKS